MIRANKALLLLLLLLLLFVTGNVWKFKTEFFIKSKAYHLPPGADPRFFLRGGTPLRNGANGANDWQMIRSDMERKTSSQGGGGVAPPTPPLIRPFPPIFFILETRLVDSGDTLTCCISLSCIQYVMDFNDGRISFSITAACTKTEYLAIKF